MALWHNYSVKHACPATMIFYLYDHYRPTIIRVLSIGTNPPLPRKRTPLRNLHDSLKLRVNVSNSQKLEAETIPFNKNNPVSSSQRLASESVT